MYDSVLVPVPPVARKPAGTNKTSRRHASAVEQSSPFRHSGSRPRAHAPENVSASFNRLSAKENSALALRIHAGRTELTVTVASRRALASAVHPRAICWCTIVTKTAMTTDQRIWRRCASAVIKLNMTASGASAPTPSLRKLLHLRFAQLRATNAGGDCGRIFHATAAREFVLEGAESGSASERWFFGHVAS